MKLCTFSGDLSFLPHNPLPSCRVKVIQLLHTVQGLFLRNIVDHDLKVSIHHPGHKDMFQPFIDHRDFAAKFFLIPRSIFWWSPPPVRSFHPPYTHISSRVSTLKVSVKRMYFGTFSHRARSLAPTFIFARVHILGSQCLFV